MYGKEKGGVFSSVPGGAGGVVVFEVQSVGVGIVKRGARNRVLLYLFLDGGACPPPKTMFVTKKEEKKKKKTEEKKRKVPDSEHNNTGLKSTLVSGI